MKKKTRNRIRTDQVKRSTSREGDSDMCKGLEELPFDLGDPAELLQEMSDSWGLSDKSLEEILAPFCNEPLEPFDLEDAEDRGSNGRGPNPGPRVFPPDERSLTDKQHDWTREGRRRAGQASGKARRLYAAGRKRNR
ncbi:MAG: hypothetical protein AB1714_07330 [Acidobacteriota bacterium]